MAARNSISKILAVFLRGLGRGKDLWPYSTLIG